MAVALAARAAAHRRTGVRLRLVEPRADRLDAAQLADAAWVLDRIFEGVCRPFKVRVEAALGGVPPTALLLAFQLHALLGFYTSTLAAVAGRAC